tara:strand:- start:6171 stop:7478 length:1308 start_codon:yes stop_codon:yes gene_type:complete
MKTKTKHFRIENVNAIIFALFLLSGLLKAFTALAGGLPVDITLLLAVLLVFMWIIAGRQKLTKSQAAFIPLCLFIIFTLLIFLSLIYSESPLYRYVKAFLWFTCVLAFIFPIFNQINIKFFAITIVFFTLICAIIYSVLFTIVKDMGLGEQELYIFSSIYLELAYFIGISIYLLFILVGNKYMGSVTSKKKSTKAVILIALIFVYLLYALVNTGARGPLLFFMLTIFCYLLVFKLPVGLKLNKSNSILSLGFILALILLILFGQLNNKSFSLSNVQLSNQSTRALDRIGLLFSDDKGNSINTRVKYLEDSTFYINKRVLFGYGFGSYGVVTTGADQKAFPHNILLESWFELGIMGFIIILLFILSSLIGVRKAPLLVFFQLFLIFNQMKSSNLPDSRVFFGMLAISLLCINLYNRKLMINSTITQNLTTVNGDQN